MAQNNVSVGYNQRMSFLGVAESAGNFQQDLSVLPLLLGGRGFCVIEKRFH